jgi:MFS family permease
MNLWKRIYLILKKGFLIYTEKRLNIINSLSVCGEKRMINLKRNIALNYLLIFFTSMGFFGTIDILFYKNFNLDFTKIALIGSVLSASILIFEIPTGAFADMIGRKWSIVIAQIFFVLTYIVLATSNSFRGFLFASFIFGLAYAFISGSRQALLYDTLKELKKTNLHTKITSNEYVLFSIAGIIGAYFGPQLFNLNVYYPVYISIAVFAISILVALFLIEPTEIDKKFSIKRSYLQIISSFKRTIKSKRLLWLVLFTIISTIGFRIFINLTSQPYLLNIGFSIKELSYLFVISSVINAFIALGYANFEKFMGEDKSFWLVILLQSLIFGMIGFFTFKFNAIFFILFCSLRGFIGMITNHYTNEHLESKERATVLSISSFIDNLFAIVFLYLAGILIDNSSIGFTHLIVGGIVTLIGIILLGTKKKWKN